MAEFTIYNESCIETMQRMADNSIDAIVTDPPYGLAFMGKRWDYDVPTVEVWRECLRVLKPGGHLLAFAGTRTQHRMAVRIEDAGFEIRDMIAWVYGSGFPKSADVSKMLDKHEQKEWLGVRKAIDNTAQSAIMEAWKEHSKTASGAGLSFTRSETETGTSTRKSGSVPASVLLQANPENSDAVALVAELSSAEARLTNGVNFNFAQWLAEGSTTELRSLATSAANSPASPVVTLYMPDSSALKCAWGWQGESTADKLKAVEALKTWLGSNTSSRQVATSALCAALTADLKLITLSQSKTFQSFDTTRQTECVSAISATITESTAESLISFTVDTLKSKAIDKAAGAERSIKWVKATNPKATGQGLDGREGATRPYIERAQQNGGMHAVAGDEPATPEAQQWAGWGTALKPSHEPVGVYHKGLTMENLLGILLVSLTQELWWSICQWSNVSVNDAKNLLNGIRLKLEKAGAFSVVESARTSALENIESAILAAQSSTSQKRTETARDTIKGDSAQELVNPSGKKPDTQAKEIQAGQADAMNMVDTFTCAITEHTEQNIALLWSDTLDAILNQANTFTTATALRLTTALKTLKCLMQASTLRSTGSSKNISPALEPITVARKPLDGTVAANVLRWGTGGLNVDGCRVNPTGESRQRIGEASRNRRYTENGGTNFAATPGIRGGDPLGRFPANLIHDGSDEVVALFPVTGPAKASMRGDRSGVNTDFGGTDSFRGHNDNGGSAARFFYCAKASKADRDEGLVGFTPKARPTMGSGIGGQPDQSKPNNRNTHPTVKPTSLMAYLVRLVTPPGGTVYDPFSGSFTTAKAALIQGFNFIGSEKHAEFCEIGRARAQHAIDNADELRDKYCSSKSSTKASKAKQSKQKSKPGEMASLF